jgi:hypothetical protein
MSSINALCSVNLISSVNKCEILIDRNPLISISNFKKVENNSFESFVFLIKVYEFNSKIQNYELSSAKINITASTYILSDSLTASENEIIVKDGFNEYKIEITKNGFETYTAEFSNSGLKIFKDNPLMVILNKKNDKAVIKSTIEQPENNVPVKKEIKNNLLAWYQFNGNAADSSGNNFHGEDYGAPGYISGLFSEARYFSNNQINTAVATDYTVIPNVIASNEFTINFWAKFDYSDTIQSLIYIGAKENINDKFFYLYLSTDNKLVAVIKDQDLNTNKLESCFCKETSNNSKSLEQNRYFNISCVFKPKKITLYVDGEIYSEFNQGFISNQEKKFLIGAYPKLGKLCYPYTGQIDELKIFDKPLSKVEIQMFKNKPSNFANLGKL